MKRINIQIRISEEEKKEVEQQAASRGFDTITAYLKFLIRQDKKELH